MTANVLEHRRAKAFAEALEAHRTGPAASSEPLGELLDTARALSALPVPGLDAEVRVVQRAQLLAAFEQTVGGGGLAAVPRQREHRHRRIDRLARRRWGRRFAITGMIAGVTVGSLAGVAAASSGALPGDPLYGMKRQLEGLRLDLADNDQERGALLLDQASTRLAEARTLVGRSGSGPLSPETVNRLGSALRDMHAEAARGRDLLRSVYRANGSLDPMRKLASFTEAQDDHWAALQPKLPTQLTPVAGQVDQLFDNLNEEVGPLHLEPPAGQPAGPSATDSGSADPAAGNSPSTGGQPAAQTPRSSPDEPAGRPGTGTQSPGQDGVAGPAKGVGNPVGGLVNGLTGSLTGNGQAGAASSAPAAGGGADGSNGQAGQAPAPASPTAGQSGAPNSGLNLPPLIPGLLPGLGLDGN
ncbi:DUF5667 domain-containing protein [Kitasatospora viridis]|uniref:DUF5667 domain-containing protein n=1 Tax=Kitasatospora viridis TaxID=281105 RepID=A0A561UIY8_9ACTN|nr:DUF5667 domain-containing protein [Kitasatospora viridis]TWF99343.1 hypothetical protein FHX73_113186 [Kitasatospora viridis]